MQIRALVVTILDLPEAQQRSPLRILWFSTYGSSVPCMGDDGSEESRRLSVQAPDLGGATPLRKAGTVAFAAEIRQVGRPVA